MNSVGRIKEKGAARVKEEEEATRSVKKMNTNLKKS